MADDAQQTQGDDKNPLDVLEELLKDSGGGAAGAAGGKGAEAPKPGELSEEELEQKRQEFEQKQAEQAQVDAQQLAQQHELLKTIKDTPEYQARVQQQEEAAAESEQKQQASDGFEITQLDHDKI